MGDAASGEPLSEPHLNKLLRLVDWRFLLRQPDVPRALDLTSGRISAALRLVTRAAPRSSHDADLVVLGYPTGRRLRAARAALRPGGEIVCIWRAPRPAGVQRARARMRRAGFADSHFYWPGPDSLGEPKLWLPLGAPATVNRALSQHPPQSRIEAAKRLLWRAAERFGVLVPVYGVARAGAAPEGSADSPDQLEELLPAPDPWVLLTGGKKSLNKVVGFPFGEDPSAPPSMVVKFARVEDSDAFLEREAENLRRLEQERPELRGVPRLRAVGRRAGRLAIAQSAVHGRPLDTVLTAANFAELGPLVTRWLITLAGDPAPQPASEWAARLAWKPLEELQDRFEGILEPEEIARARDLLGDLDDLPLPLVWVHRDCDPWNIILAENGAPTLLDWEEAEPDGLPGLDLANFLLTSALLADRTPSDPSTGPGPALECHRRLQDPATALGRVARDCIAEYCDSLSIDPDLFPRLRMLCWLQQAVSSWSSTSPVEADGPDPDPLRRRALIGLAREEMRLLAERR